MKKKMILVGIVMSLMIFSASSKCTEETGDDGYTKEEVLELGELYEGNIRWYDYGIITNHTNRTVFIYDITKDRITISNELQEGGWVYSSYRKSYRKSDYYPSIEYPEFASEDYVGATIRIDYIRVEYYDESCYIDGVYEKLFSEKLVSGHEIIEFNHTYWQQFQSDKQDFYAIKDTIVNDTIHFNLDNGIDKYGAGMFTQKSIRMSHPHPDVTVKLTVPEHLKDDIVFTYELVSSDIALFSATVYGTSPGRFKHGDYIVTLEYSLQSWHMYSDIQLVGSRDVLVSLG